MKIIVPASRVAHHQRVTRWRIKLKIAGVLALSMSIILTGCSGKSSNQSAKKDSTIRIAFLSGTGKRMSGPEGWAFKTGEMQRSLAKAGITNIEPIGFPAGPDMNIALASGRIDLATYGDTPAIVGKSAGLPTRLIAINSGGGRRSAGSTTAIVVMPNGPKTIPELAGKKIGVARGTIMERFLLGVLDQNNLLGKVQIVHIPNADGEAALRGGGVDAIVGSYNALLSQRGYRVIADAKDYPKLAGVNVTIVSEKFLAKHPDFPKIWNESRGVWYKSLVAHSDEYYAYAAANAKLDVSLYKKLNPLQLYIAEPFTPEGLERLNGTKSFLLRLKLISKDFTIDSWRIEQ